MVLLTEEISQPSSSTSPAYDYDVFLSFRGADTRNNFTDHLYKALLDATIHTFLDDARIETGSQLKPELEYAIKASRASIIVLSENYASSTWCLEELLLILEQRRTSDHIVFPVFYNIEPTDVRKQQKSFAVAMEKHKQTMERELDAGRRSQMALKLEQWKKALTEVANIKGEEANDRRETLLIEGIVKEINRRLDIAKRSMIPKVIGMESLKWTMSSFLKDRSSEAADIFTIWGMAGIGKTCLAEYIFQLHYRDFERSCFLQDIERRYASSNGLLDLQKQFLKDIHYGSWMDIQNTNSGTSKIAELLPRKRTLLVLDDASKFEHMDVFIGTKSLHPGSKIIITSKNELLTENWLFQTQSPLKHTKQVLQGLYEDESLELLSWHAFGRIDPKECKKEEPKKVVEYCQGHPLALKVLGSSLRNEDITWEDILESLGKEINPDIKKVLEISIDSLPNKKDKDVFMHIACYFVGKDRYFTEEILKACGICNLSTIKNLINRCLLTIEGNYLCMHQLLQDIGKDMVYQESPKKPWKRSLLWHHEECFEVLRKGKGTSNIKGFVLDMKSSEDETSCGSVFWWLLSWVYGLCSLFQHQESGFDTLAFANMCNLRILRLNYVQLNGSYKNFPKDLRWLCMHGFPLSYIPLSLAMEKMVALDMTNSNLKQLWKKPKLLKSLKFLNLSCCHELVSVGPFSGLPSLERLILSGCRSLNEVCESIGNYCDKLEVLDLSECNKLKKLPRSLRELKKLTELLLNGCSDLSEFSYEIKDLESLQVLETNNVNINNTQAIPRSYNSFMISLPSSLVRLSLENNKLSNASFPKNFHGLSMLKRLDLGGNPIDSLPDFVRSLNRLECLDLSRCSRLTTVLGVPSTIKELFTSLCHSLETITFSPETSTIPYVSASWGCKSLVEIQGKFKVQGIAKIEEEMLLSLGWIKIKDEKDFQHKMTYTHFSSPASYMREINRLEMIYEYGVFSTFFEGKELPYWITHRSKTSSISITIPSCPNNYRVQGLNVCLLTTSSDMGYFPWLVIKNLTKNYLWEYGAKVWVKLEASEGGKIWLSHWIFRENEFEEGDEAIFQYDEIYSRIGAIKEIGISLVHGEINNKEDPLASYKSCSWKRIACQDLSKPLPRNIYQGPHLEKW